MEKEFKSAIVLGISRMKSETEPYNLYLVKVGNSKPQIGSGDIDLKRGDKCFVEPYKSLKGEDRLRVW